MSNTNAEEGPSTAHHIRITNHGKINGWVSFALEHLQKYEDKALVLHTLPASKGKTPTQEPLVEDDGTNDLPGGVADAKKADRLHPSMATIPRLISVVEIIKREYLKTVDPTLAEAGKLSGLHQYNELGDLVEAGYVVQLGNEEEQRVEACTRALQGRNHLKQKKIAFMRVTLSRKEIPELMRPGVTYQTPAVRKLSKSTRARVKKRLKGNGNNS